MELQQNKNYLMQSNILIENFKNEMKDIGELRAFYTLCAIFFHDHYTDPTVSETKINVKSLLEYMGYASDGDNPENYIKYLKKLRQHAFFTAQDEKYKENYEFLPCFAISVPKAWVTGESTTREDVTIKWNKKFIPFITNQYDEDGKPIGNYTLLLLQSLVPLRSKAAQELYIQLSKIAGLDYPTKKTVEEIRAILNLTAPSYNATKEVTRNLKEYIAEINKKTNIRVTFSILKNTKDKRKTDGYSFRVKNTDLKSNLYFSGCPDVYITQQDYINLTEGKTGKEISLVKQKANELQELIKPTKENHSPKPIKSHYLWLRNAINSSIKKEVNESSFAQRQYEPRRPSEADRKSREIGRNPSYDLEKIKEETKKNTEIKY